MNRVLLYVLAIVGIATSYAFLSTSYTWALTPDEVIRLKNAGVSDQTIELMIRQEQEVGKRRPEDAEVRKEIKDEDGKSVIRYSTGRPTGDTGGAADKQTEKAWEMLRTIIIDNRKPR
jgi:hypothetical protein